MTKEQLAAKLDGREYGDEITKQQEIEAQRAGLFVIFAYSDDCMEIRGLQNDEFGCYNGNRWLMDSEGILPDWDSLETEDECEEYSTRKKNAREIEAVWDAPIVFVGPWSYRTSWPHATFVVMDDGAPFCRGIVLDSREMLSFLNT